MPDFFRPILWSYEFGKIEPGKHRKIIVINSINYGDLRHWRWIVNFYGKDIVAKTLEECAVTEIRPRARQLAALLLPVKNFNYATRGVK